MKVRRVKKGCTFTKVHKQKQLLNKTPKRYPVALEGTIAKEVEKTLKHSAELQRYAKAKQSQIRTNATVGDSHDFL